MSVHVFVATTQGPVAIQRITREEVDVPSVVCIDGGNQRAGISNHYYDFVRKGTGLIGRQFQHESFRVDIDANIDEGNSWQLGFYMAHLAEASAVLGHGEPAAGDLVLWVTGEVKVDGSVQAVAGVAKKFRQSQEAMNGWLAAGARIRLLLPADNASELDEAQGAFLKTQSHSHLEPLPLAQLPDAVAFASWHTQTGTAPAPVLKSFLARALFSVALLAVLFFIGQEILVGDVSEVSRPKPVVTDEPSPLQSPKLLVSRVALGENCEQSRVVELDAEVRSTVKVPKFKSTALNTLCKLELVTQQFAFGIALDTIALIEFEASPLGWVIPLPEDQSRDRRYALVLTPPAEHSRMPGLGEALKTLERGVLLRPGELQTVFDDADWSVAIFHHELTTL